MDLKTMLREPLFVDETTDIDKIWEGKKKEYIYFVRKGGNIYPIRISSFLEKEELCSEKLLGLANEAESVYTIPFADLNERVLDILSRSVTLVDDDGSLKFLLREDFLLFMKCTGANPEIEWLNACLAPHPMGTMIVDLKYSIVNSNPEALRILGVSNSSLNDLRLDKLIGLANFKYTFNTQSSLRNQLITTIPSEIPITVDFIPIVMNKKVLGFTLVIQENPSVEKMVMELNYLKQLNIDLAAILSTTYDEIMVVDARGKILSASKHYITSQWDSPPKTLVGKQILTIKNENDLICRVIREVQKKKQKVTLMQNDTDSPGLTTGIPVFLESGQLQRIVIASRELTEISRLQRELEQTRKLSEDYRKELERLRERNQGIVPLYASRQMHEVMKEAERIAQFSATVLLSGESGVGKEVIASAIHSMGERRDQPLIKINCAAIPETLLESELFGYERGAFSGANQQGKTGLIVKAHKGSLFLDEISELPLVTQGKLLRAIQEREVYPVGGTEPIKFDIQIVAATNRPLAELVAQGKFREDLFYRINVFPIEIPPLRDRKEDIALLANHFLTQFNQLYQRKHRFSSEALEVLEAYSFPGNVRELQNLIQRIAIRNDGELIERDTVERILMHSDIVTPKQGGRFNRVIPLELALNQVEEELVSMAMKQYHSTTKAAKALGVSQATVSRKYRQILSRSQQEIK